MTATSVILLAALKKVDFDVMRLDAGTLVEIADLDPGGSPGGNVVDLYLSRTCGIDSVAFRRSVRFVPR